MATPARATALRHLVFPLLIGFVLAACGREDTPPAESSETRSEPAVNVGYGEPATGFIEVGGQRHDLTVQRCISMFGALSGQAVSASEPDNVFVTFEFSPADWRERDVSEGWEETGTVRIRSDDPYNQWETGISAVGMYNLGGMAPESLDITSLEVAPNGRSARGEAVFIEMKAVVAGAPQAVSGAFEFSCPPR
jgi:hypothetical protein